MHGTIKKPHDQIVVKDDQFQRPGENFYQLVGGKSAGQTIVAHVEEGLHVTPDGERYVRGGGHHFVAESLVRAAFGGKR